MTCSTCPNCGFDLERVEDLKIGELEIVGGAAVYWQQQRVDLTTSKVLLINALARTGGAAVANRALVEAMGTDGDRSIRVLDTQICLTRRAFKAIDPAFNRIERGRNRWNGGWTRWRVEALNMNF